VLFHQVMETQVVEEMVALAQLQDRLFSMLAVAVEQTVVVATEHQAATAVVELVATMILVLQEPTVEAAAAVAAVVPMVLE
jgi:hypothetical protein